MGGCLRRLPVRGGWDADGKGRSIWDDFAQQKCLGHVKNDETGNMACDVYHRYASDAELMQQLGLRAYRFSVSWPRIIPEGRGSVNEKGLAYYDRLVDALLERGIEPWMTLYHWDLPSALQAQGGWLSRETVEAFGEYAALMAKHFDGRVRRYMTINEPQCVTKLGYGTGAHAPGLTLSGEAQAQVMHHLALTHSAGMRAIRAHSSQKPQVGAVPCGRLCYPLEDTNEGRIAAERASFDLSGDDWIFTFNIFLDSLILRHYDDSAPEAVRRFADTIPEKDWAAMEAPDFIGINVYHGTPVNALGEPSGRYQGFPLTACKWPFTPQVMRFGPLALYQRYGLPMYITENGQSANDRIFRDGKVHDLDRIDYLHRYLTQLSEGIAQGAPVRGYFQWSFLDNFEWAEGYDERFGLVYVDYPSQRRIPKDSAYWYAQVMRTNGAILNEP